MAKKTTFFFTNYLRDCLELEMLLLKNILRNWYKAQCLH